MADKEEVGAAGLTRKEVAALTPEQVKTMLLKIVSAGVMEKGPVTKWPKGAVNPIMEAVRGTNAAVGMPDNVYHVPGGPKLGSAGWTLRDSGNMFVTDKSAIPIPNIVAHERAHNQFAHLPEGMPYNENKDWAESRFLARNMETIQPEGSNPKVPLWGDNPSEYPEEQIASLRGYEGSLPVNTPISKSPIAPQLFKAEGIPYRVNDADLLNYYYQKSTDPKVGGIWGGQTPESTVGERAMSLGRNLATRLGINTANRNPVAMPDPATIVLPPGQTK